jgi:hypothetical protein
MNANQFKSFKLNSNLQPIRRVDFFQSNLFWWLLLAPLLLISIAIFTRKKKKEIDDDVKGSKRRKANKLARKYLATAKKNLGDQDAFYVSLERALHNYLKAKLHIETSDFSKDKIISLLADKQLSQTASADFIGLLKACEFARYTPASSDAMKQDYEKAVSVIAAIDKQF